MNEFLCAQCGEYRLIKWLAYACASPDGLLGVCGECAEGV